MKPHFIDNDLLFKNLSTPNILIQCLSKILLEYIMMKIPMFGNSLSNENFQIILSDSG